MSYENFYKFQKRLVERGTLKTPNPIFGPSYPGPGTSAHTVCLVYRHGQRGQKCMNLQVRWTQISSRDLKSTYFYLGIMKFIAFFIQLYIEVVSPTEGLLVVRKTGQRDEFALNVARIQKPIICMKLTTQLVKRGVLQLLNS